MSGRPTRNNTNAESEESSQINSETLLRSIANAISTLLTSTRRNQNPLTQKLVLTNLKHINKNSEDKKIKINSQEKHQISEAFGNLTGDQIKYKKYEDDFLNAFFEVAEEPAVKQARESKQTQKRKRNEASSSIAPAPHQGDGDERDTCEPIIKEIDPPLIPDPIPPLLDEFKLNMNVLFSLSDTLKDFPKLVNYVNELLPRQHINVKDLKTNLIKYKNFHKSSPYWNLLHNITSSPNDFESILASVYNKNQIFTDIFQKNLENLRPNEAFVNFTNINMDNILLNENIDQIIARNINDKIVNINVNLNYYTFILGNSQNTTGIFTNTIESQNIVDGREDSPNNNIIYTNNNSTKILKKIFGPNSSFIVNSGIKQTVDGDNNLNLTHLKKDSLARIFDINKSNYDIDQIIETNEITYGLSSQNKEFVYIQSIFAQNKTLYMNRNNKTYSLIPNDPPLFHCALHNIKSNLTLSLKPSQNQGKNQKKESRPLTIHEIITNFTELIGRDLLCCLNAEDLTDETNIIRFLTELKKSGDMNTAKSALKTGAVFLTGDILAAAYAIYIGCKTVLSVKEEGNYVYYIYKPQVIPQVISPFIPTPGGPTVTITLAPPGAQQPAQIVVNPINEIKDELLNALKYINANINNPVIILINQNELFNIYIDRYNMRNNNKFISELQNIANNARNESKIESGTRDSRGRLNELLEAAESQKRTRDKSSSGGKAYKSRKMKGGNISNDEFINITIEFLYERSLEGQQNYLEEAIQKMIEIITKKPEDSPIEKKIKIDQNLVDHMKDYLDNIHILKYGYSTPLQYTVLRFLELSNVPFEGAPFTMERYATWIRENVEKYRKAEKAEKVEKEEREKSAEARLQKAKQAQAEAEAEREKRPLLVSNQPSKQLYKRESRYERESISESKGLRTPSRGGNQNNNTAIIDEYEKKLASLYKKYIKLAESNKTEQELSKEFEKLDMGIQKLSAKIKKTMEKEIKK